MKEYFKCIQNEAAAMISNARQNDLQTNAGKTWGSGHDFQRTSSEPDQTKQHRRGERNLHCRMPFFHTLFIDLPNPRGISWKFHRDSKVHLER